MVYAEVCRDLTSAAEGGARDGSELPVAEIKTGYLTAQ